MKHFHLRTDHFDGEIDENVLRESGDFCDPEVKDILMLGVGQQKRYDGGRTVVERTD